TSLFLCTRLLPPTSTLFPYTTLFRSRPVRLGDRVVDRLAQRRGAGGAGRRRDAGDAGPGPGGAGPGRSLGLAVLRHWGAPRRGRSEEHTSELQSRENLVCRLLLEKKK